MNFRNVSILIVVLLLSSCGKKGPPKVPADSVLPSYEDHFINENKIENQKKDEDDSKKKNK